MTTVALLYLYESWRTPRALRKSDTIRNAALVLNGKVIAGIQWRATR